VLASIPSPPWNGFHLGPIEVHVYGLMYILAVAAAVAIVVRRWEAEGGSRALVYEVAAWGFPAGIVGGRLYFDLTSPNLVPDQWWGSFAIWQGGLGIWGGIAAGTFAGLFVLRRRRADVPRFLDAAAPALLVAQAIGRIGNYFNQELFGGPTNLPWGLQISAAHRPPGYAHFATFQPTFLYELTWNLGLAAFLVWLGHHRKIRPPGLFALYVTGYSAFRIFEELLRVDPANRILGFRLNFFVACALTLAGATWFVVIQRRDRKAAGSARRKRWPIFLALGWATVAAAGCGSAQSPKHTPGQAPAEASAPAAIRSS
jgi:prolipoprotein diacylglyceryl transferase